MKPLLGSLPGLALALVSSVAVGQASQSGAVWDPDRFQVLVGEGEVRSRAWLESRGHSDFDAAVAAFDEAAALLDAALGGGAVPEERVEAVEVQRFRLAMNAVFLQAEAGVCEAAERRLAAALVQAPAVDVVTELAGERRAQLEGCHNDEEVVAEDSVAEPEPDDLVEPAAAPEGAPFRVAGWTLVGVAGACGLAALGVDFWNRGNRSEWEDAEAACERGEACDPARFDELGSRMDRARTAIWALGGAAVAAGIAGVTLLLLDDGDEEPAPVVVAPLVTPQGAGVALGLSF